MSSIKTRQGDMWDMIAYRAYGREHLMHIIMEANPEYREVLVFSAGIELTVPEIVVESASPVTPPWGDA